MCRPCDPERKVLSHVRTPERRTVKESNAAYDRDDGGGGEASRDQVEMVLADVLERQFIWRLHEVEAEVLDSADVGFLSQRRHVANGHIVDHTLPQRRNFLCHGRLLSIGLNEQSSQTG